MKVCYRPKSWSQQARQMADRQFGYFINANECGDPESWLLQLDPETGWTCADEDSYIHFFSISYRHPLIRRRAAKRFGKLVRKYRGN